MPSKYISLEGFVSGLESNFSLSVKYRRYFIDLKFEEIKSGSIGDSKIRNVSLNLSIQY